MRHKLCVIGGGTGTYTVLSGLKNAKNVKLTAIVASTDDGGSNKKFRDEFGLLPPSDFRACLAALASDDADQTLRKLMSYRFSKGLGLEGQTFGNILIAALTDIEQSQLIAFEKIGKILRIKGEVLPVTLDNVQLMAEYEDGTITFGEHLIDEPENGHNSEQRIKKLFLNKRAVLYPKTVSAINGAEYIILGPGDLYTSIIANLIVPGMIDVVSNSKAKIIYISNLMTKMGQTYNFKASDHVLEIEKYIGRKVDYIFLNSAQLPQSIVDRYYGEKKDVPVTDDLEDDRRVVRADIISDELIQKHNSDKLYRSFLRHDANKLATAIKKILG